MDKTLSNKELTVIVLAQGKRIETLEKENLELKTKLAKYEHPKNSSNSSIPPSKDENRPKKTSSLREKSDRKPGGQPGHEGNTLKMTDNPNMIHQCIPNFCNECGCDLKDIPKEFVGKRQVIDIPPIKPVVTEYQIFQKKCKCGCQITESFPEGVKASVSYGTNIESTVAYLHTRQYLPHRRMVEALNDLFGLSIGEGSVDILLDRFNQKSNPFYQHIIQKISKAPTVGADETGAKVNGKKYWYWTWVTDFLTLIVPSDNRGKKTIDAIFPNGFPNSTLVSDCWASHLNTHAENHQLCTAHLLRELKYLNQIYQNKWSEDFSILLTQAINLKKEMCLEDYLSPDFKLREEILQKFEHLRNQYRENEETPKLNAFVNRMKKRKDYVFQFLYKPDVPPDNNAAERGVRNIKVKQKISGQFKSEKGALRFAVIRSVIDTLIKNGVDILQALKFIANFAYK